MFSTKKHKIKSNTYRTFFLPQVCRKSSLPSLPPKCQALAAFRGDEVDFWGILLQFLNYTIFLVTVGTLKIDVSGAMKKLEKKQSKYPFIQSAHSLRLNTRSLWL